MSDVAARPPRDLRETIQFLAARGELTTIRTEVDPVLEIAGIEKALDNGPAFLFENVKGYPGVRDIGNVLARVESITAMFGASDARQLKLKCVEAIKSPLPAVVVENAACQEIAVSHDIDVPGLLPMLRHTSSDAGRIMGGGIVLFTEPRLAGATDLTFRRIHFRGKDWASIMFNPVSHLTRILRTKKGEKVPVTINIGNSPAVMLVAGTWALHMIMPDGCDELGVAGRLQGSPVQLCRAKTVDAFAIADSEWVIEGYILPERVWESDEAEKLGKPRMAPFFPEWNGYLGKAQSVNKFQATAVTHRRERPIFYSPLAASFEADNMSKIVREACYLEFAQRFAPGLVVDVNIPYGNKVNTGAVFKVKKRSSGDDTLLRNLLGGVQAISMARLVIAVDDDINIYNADDIWWAVATRLNTATGISRASPGSAATGYVLAGLGDAEGGEGITIDATTPFAARSSFQRAHYPSDSVDLSRHFSRDEIARIRAQQCDWGRFLAEIGG